MPRDDAGAPPEAPPFWNQPLADTLGELATCGSGLSSAEAARRHARHGDNVLAVRTRRRILRRFLDHVRSPLVLLLAVADVLALALGDIAGALVIAVIVVGSVLLDVVQEHRATGAVDRLRRSVALQSRALRDGRWQPVPAADLVPGDVVRVAAGDLVPADGRVLAATDCFVRQGVLTGEPFPVEKQAGDPTTPTADPAEATHAVFMGTSVISGSATLVVCRTGARTRVGAIADALQRQGPPTAFEEGVRHFGQMVVRASLVLVLLLVAAHTLAGRSPQETFLFALAIAVGITPELLPMILSVTLARGAVRMAARGVIVKRLSAIHDLGSVDVLCTDKTGTLTEAVVRVERHVDACGSDDARVLELAVINSRFETGLRSPLDEAILAHAGTDAGGWVKIDEVPFDFERRRVSVLVERDGARLLVLKGAPEDILPLCTRHAGPGGPVPLDDAARAAARGTAETLGRDGLRVLAVASLDVPPDRAHARMDDAPGLVLAGYVAFVDPPKAGVDVAIERLRRSHLKVKVVTGDTEGVARHVCRQVGLPVTGLMTGADVERLDDHALAARVARTDVFCRVTPQQKGRIVQALRRRGHVVAYLGDGVNDAPPLHAADVGISVQGAVDVAREAAALVLLQPDLGVLHDAVREGRRTVANAMKYILMATSSNFGNMLTLAVTSVVLPFLPLLPTQILLNNLLYDLSEVAIPGDTVDDRETASPHGWDPDLVRGFMLALGSVSSVFDGLTFALLLQVFGADPVLFRTGWFVESLASQVLVIFVIRTRGAPWRSRPARGLVVTSLGVVALAALLPWTPVAGPLGFVAPPPGLLLAIAALVAAYLVTAEVAKRAFYARWRRPARGRTRASRP